MRKLSQLIKKTHLDSTGGKRQLHARANLKGKVFIHDEHRLYITQLVNLSAGGLFVAQLIAIPEGKTVRIVIKSPALDKALQLEGRVVRVENKKRRGMAVQFINLDHNTRVLLDSCINELRVEGALNAA